MSPLLLALLVSVPFILVLLVEPVLRRTAWRNAVQRPREAVLVAMGSLLGAAIITGSFVVNDTFDHSLQRRVHRELGTIDEVVAFQGRADWETGKERLRGLATAPYDGSAAMGVMTMPASAADGTRRSAPQAQLIELSFEEARSLGPASVSGISGATPARGKAAVSAQLADKLRLQAGDTVRTYPYGRRVDFEVVRVLPQVGMAGFRLAAGDVADNILVAPGTVAELAAEAEGTDAIELAPPSWLVAVSNIGGVEDGGELTDRAVRDLRRRLQGLSADIFPAKRDASQAALSGSSFLGEYLDTFGSFGVLAGVLLLINVFVMMGEERMPELGSMRSVGMGRGAVVAALSTEGWIYSVAGCAVGAFAGLGLGRLMVAVVSGLFPAENEAYGLSLQFAADPGSSQWGFAWGLLISVVAVFLTSVRISRLDVIQAIRNLPQTRTRRTGTLLAPVAGSLAVGAGALVTVTGFIGQGEVSTMVGPVLLMVGFVPLLRRLASVRSLMTMAALGIVLWAVVGRVLVGPAPESPAAIVVQGISMIAAAVVLITLQQHQLGRVLRRVGSGRRGVTARMALAYPLARPVRTALTLAPFCMVIFTLALIASLSKLFTEQLEDVGDRSGGGYNVLLASSPANPLPLDEVRRRDDVRVLAPLTWASAAFVASPSGRPLLSSVTGFDEQFFARGRGPKFFDRGQYPTDEAAYRAVLENPDLTIVSSVFLQEYLATEEVGNMVPGRVFTIVDPATAQARELEIAAVISGDLAGNGALYGQSAVRELLGGRAVTSRAYVAVDDPGAFERDVEGQYIPNGARVESFDAMGQDLLDFVSQLVNVYWTYLGVGLVVGVVGVAVMMVRAVRERRRQIGVLRALGFEAGMVGRSFVLEATFISLQAIFLGIGLAVASAFSSTHSEELREFLRLEPQFTPATPTLAVIAAVTLVAALLATAGPARSAAAIPPSEALRLVD